MEIAGLQKMTLLDFPGKVACTVFLGGCNFRCPFCHNYEMVDGSLPPLMDDAALIAFLGKRRGLLDGVCFTGGEPLLQKGLPQLVRDAKAIGYAVKLDTNGTSPDALAALLDARLVDYVAMDVKNSPERYAETAGMEKVDLGAIRRSIALLLGNGVECEFRTTVVAGLHDAESIRAAAGMVRGAKRYFIQPFVDRETVPARGLVAPSDAMLEAMLAAARESVPAAAIRGR